MIAKLPTLPPASAPRADQALSSAESKQQTQRQISFEHTLSHRQRTQRQRDDAADAPVVDRPVTTRGDRAEGRRSERADTSKSLEKQTVSTDAAPADEAADSAEVSQEDAAAAPVAEHGAATDEMVVQVEDVAAELPAQEPQPDADVAQENPVDALAMELVQQVTQAIAAPMQALTISDEAATAPAMPATSALVNKPESTALPAALDGDLAAAIGDAAVVADAESKVKAMQMVTIKHDAQNPATPSHPAASVASELKEIVESSTPSAKAGPGISEAAAITLTSVTTASSSPLSAGEALSAQLAQLPQGDEAQVRDQINMGRLTRGLSSAVNQRGGSVTLRLTPPELGLVRIDMAVREGVVNAKFTAQSESVRNLLMDQMGQLRQALDRQGLLVDKIDVQVTQQSSSSGFERQPDDMNRDGRSAGQYQSSRQGRGESSDQERTRPREADSFDRALANVTP